MLLSDISSDSAGASSFLQKCRTHPVPRSHHGLLLATQLVQDVVGQLDAARPQFSCRGQNTEKAAYECVYLFIYLGIRAKENKKQRKKKSKNRMQPEVNRLQQSAEVSRGQQRVPVRLGWIQFCSECCLQAPQGGTGVREIKYC